MAENNLVMEERTEIMVNPTETDSQFYRTAHFLTPLFPSSNQADPRPPPPPPPQEQTSAACNRYKDLPFKMNFRGVRIATKKWETWVYKMCSLHEKIWKKVGIFDAIMSSLYNIHIEDELIFGFSEKWCPSTNSFVFPWGEATVTLEDIMILGGFSVTGDSILSPVSKDSEMGEALDRLHSVRQTLNRSKRRATEFDWMNKFMKESSSEIEHEAFLVLWLSRFVFPINSRRSVCKDAFSIAVRLARGVKIALAPAVLASIYQSLSLLKSTLIAARRLVEYGGDDSSVLEVVISAPLALFQVWVFERFPSVRPKSNSIRENEPRMARWRNMKRVGSAIHSVAAAESFVWCPYKKTYDDVFTRKVYKDNGYWVEVDDTDLYKELEVLVRCLRVSELVGLEPYCIEQYQPHRVAMQFGMDQDIPFHVARDDETTDVAWSNYNRPFIDAYLYVPSRFNKSGVTTRYLNWWKTESENEDLIPLAELFRKIKRKKCMVNGAADNIPGSKDSFADFAPKSKRIHGVSRMLQCRKKKFKSKKRHFKSYEEYSKEPVSPPPGFSLLHRSPVDVWDSGTGSLGKQPTEDNGNIQGVNSIKVEPLEPEINNKPTKEGKLKVGGVVEADHEQMNTTDEFLEGFEERVETLERLFSLFRQGELDQLMANYKPQE